MKKIIIILLSALIIAATFTGCGKGGNEMFKDASPDTSAMELYSYDGEKVTRAFLYDVDQEKELLEKLSKVSVSEAEYSAESIKAPAYGVFISKKDGYPLACAFTDGLIITQDGKAYEFKFDFEAMQKNYGWEETKDAFGTSAFPCARELSLIGGRWNTGFMTKANQLKTPDGIEMKLVSRETEKITVELTNNTDTEWMYGEHFAIQVKLDGEWYDIPMTSGNNWAFNDIGYVLMPGQSQEQLYCITMYGEMPEGEYRLVMQGLSVEI